MAELERALFEGSVDFKWRGPDLRKRLLEIQTFVQYAWTQREQGSADSMHSALVALDDLARQQLEKEAEVRSEGIAIKASI